MNKNILMSLLLISWALLAATPSMAAPEAPRVVVSIKPIHSLVSSIMTGIGSPLLLIKGGGSPHGYALRPSEARALNEAQLVVWVGPELESFLAKSLTSLGKQARQLQLTGAMPELLLPIRAGGNWEHHHDHSAEDHVMTPAGGFDPHLWLGPVQAKRITELAVAALGEIDPANRDRYRANGDRLQLRLDALQAELDRKLAPIRNTPYIVFHDAFQYFEHAFRLNAVGAVALNPARGPGLRRILEIRQTIRELNARCVFSEPQFEPRLVATIIEGTDTTTGVLDPIGATLPEGPDSYFILMNNLAEALIKGLSANQPTKQE